MSTEEKSKNKHFQRLSFSQLRWVWSAYWRLWVVATRIKFKQLFGSMKWVMEKTTISESHEALGVADSAVALKMHESVRLAARLHVFDLHCLAKSIVLADMLRARKFQAIVVIGVNKADETLNSHAWVEVDGARVAEPDSIQQDFTILKH